MGGGGMCVCVPHSQSPRAPARCDLVRGGVCVCVCVCCRTADQGILGIVDVVERAI
jgi:hypothetical protein